MLPLVLVLGLEVRMNHIGIDYKDTLGSSTGSFDGMNYGKNLLVNLQKYIEQKSIFGDGGIRMWSMKLKSRQISGVNLK